MHDTEFEKFPKSNLELYSIENSKDYEKFDDHLQTLDASNFYDKYQKETNCINETVDYKRSKFAKSEQKNNTITFDEQDFVDENILNHKNNPYEEGININKNNYNRSVTLSPHLSTNMDDISRTSSELMLVLMPPNDNIISSKGIKAVFN